MFYNIKKVHFIKNRLHLIINRTREGVKNLRMSIENINFAPDFGNYGLENVLLILKIVHFAKLSLQK